MRTVKGYAIVFNSTSELLYGEFREIIKPEAVTKELINNSDIFMLYNHDNNSGVLARSKKGKGTLKIRLDSKGVFYEFEAPKTLLGDSVLESLKRDDVSSSSFAFSIGEGGDKWEKTSDGKYLRTINKFKTLSDFSIVPIPAYTQSSAYVG